LLEGLNRGPIKSACLFDDWLEHWRTVIGFAEWGSRISGPVLHVLLDSRRLAVGLALGELGGREGGLGGIRVI
jgi:hypothetical protein